MEASSKRENLTKTLANMNFVPEKFEDEEKKKEYNKIPFGRLAALGAGMKPIVDALQQFVGNGSGTYRITVEAGRHLAKAKDGAGYLAAELSDKNNQLLGQARLDPVGLDPTAVFMAAALANIDRKLDAIQASQKEMLDFVKQKEKSEIRGNLTFLAGITADYRHNWNNKLYKSSHHVKVLDIKQSAEQKIDFFRELIKEKIDKKDVVHIDQDVKKQIEELKDLFKDYKMSLYMYAYSAFEEVMLLENYAKDYLTAVSKKIEDYLIQYQELHSECAKQVEKYTGSSLQSVALKALSKASKASGEFLEKVPIISKSQIDEGLIKAGNKLSELHGAHADKLSKQFSDKEQENITQFIDCINLVNEYYNNDIELVFDKDNLYVGLAPNNDKNENVSVTR